MTPERWVEAQRIVARTLERPANEREHFMRESCGDDAALCSFVSQLLADMEWDDSPVRASIEAAASALIEGSAISLIGQVVGAWRIVERIAFGGMGAVYLAERDGGEFDQKAALKLVNPALMSPEALARFQSERRILASLNHPNIARLLDGGRTPDGLPWLAMEYIEGEQIDAFCRLRKLDTRARLVLFQKACAAVEYAHQNLVVHRDIKPSNLLVDARGEPRLLDFGVAKLIESDQIDSRAAATVADQRILTPRYASPEQLTGRPITTATDIYSLGVMLYELLTDRSPYAADTTSPADLHRAITEAEPERPSAAVARGEAAEARNDRAVQRLRRELHGDLDNIVLTALQKEPGRRYASVAAFSDDIERYLHDRPVLARRADWRYRTAKFVRRHRGMTVSILATLLIGVAAIVLHTQRLAIERDRARAAERLAAAEADTARTVAGFLVETFSAVDPLTAAPNPDITARELLDRAAANLRDSDEASDEVLRRVGLSIGAAYSGLGLPTPAREFAERAIRDMETVGDVDSREYADAQRLLARAAALEDDWSEAREAGRRAVAAYERLGGERSAEAAQTLADLSRTYRMLSDNQASAAAAERAYAVLSEVRGADAPSTLDALLALSSAVATTGAWDRAIELLLQARAGYVRRLGPDHVKTADTYRAEALILYRQGRYTEGLAQAEQGVAAMRRAAGESDQRVAPALRMVYLNATHAGDVQRAYTAIREAISIIESAPERNSENLQLAYSNIGKLLLDEGHTAAAEQWFQRSYDVAAAVYGPESANQFAYLYMYSGIIARQRGDYPTARSLLDRAVAAQLKHWPPEHVEVMKMRMHREYIECFADPARAVRGLDEVVATLERSVGPDHPITAQALGYLAVANAKLGRMVSAHAQFGRALERLGARAAGSVQYREALQSYAEFARKQLPAADAAPILDRYASVVAQRTPLELE